MHSVPDGQVRTRVRARSPAVRRYDARKSRCASSAVTGDDDNDGAVVVVVESLLPVPLALVAAPLPLAEELELETGCTAPLEEDVLFVGVVLET